MGKRPKTLLSHLSKAFTASALKLMKQALSALIALTLISAGLSACAFKPLYGPTATNQQLKTVLAGVQVPEVPGRVGQQVRNELIFRFTGGGAPTATQYKLVLAVRESATSQLVQRDGDSRSQIYQLTTDFKLYSATNEKDPLHSGKSYSKASFTDDDSVYSNVRSRRDAENRAAKAVADDIQGRIAAYLSGNS